MSQSPSVAGGQESEAESDLSPGEDVTSLGLDYLPGDVTLS